MEWLKKFDKEQSDKEKMRDLAVKFNLDVDFISDNTIHTVEGSAYEDMIEAIDTMAKAGFVFERDYVTTYGSKYLNVKYNMGDIGILFSLANQKEVVRDVVCESARIEETIRKGTDLTVREIVVEGAPTASEKYEMEM